MARMQPLSVCANRMLRFKKLKSTKAILLAIAILLAMFLVPVPYLPKRACTLEPKVRHHVTAPSDAS